ncbi:hypothetical protein EJD97_012192 [Solanum chilense]|uniref:Gag-pol polyprotein n=1 Tax=Solanum chilense TaxID=4083 RepID=A0A6N2C8K8_SOLCI|nr:hypothetical protein EJD97_012192 [Solanum chilense]
MRNTGRRVGKAADGGNQAYPQSLAAADKVSVNPSGFTYGEDITAQAAKEVSSNENPHAGTMDSRLMDFTITTPLVYYGSKTDEDPQEFIYEINKILCAMGVDQEANAKLTA